jgi:hypothetical protein
MAEPSLALFVVNISKTGRRKKGTKTRILTLFIMVCRANVLVFFGVIALPGLGQCRLPTHA